MAQPIFKLYAILSTSAVKAMNGNRGRMVTQAAHGFVHALWDASDRFPDDAMAFRSQPSAFKVVLVVDDSAQLLALAEKYRLICGASLVEERGTRTDGTINEAAKGVTCLGLGPIRIDLIEEDLSSLKSFV